MPETAITILFIIIVGAGTLFSVVVAIKGLLDSDD
jgi:hypothetical protein